MSFCDAFFWRDYGVWCSLVLVFFLKKMFSCKKMTLWCFMFCLYIYIFCVLAEKSANDCPKMHRVCIWLICSICAHQSPKNTSSVYVGRVQNHKNTIEIYHNFITFIIQLQTRWAFWLVGVQMRNLGVAHKGVDYIGCFFFTRLSGLINPVWLALSTPAPSLLARHYYF